jgi:hypothetical protein
MIVRYYVVSQNAHSVTKFMKQSPLRDDNIVQIVPSIARKKNPLILWSPKLHGGLHKNQALSYITPVYHLLSYFCKIHFNIGFPFTTISSKKFLSFRFFYQLLACISLPPHTGHKHGPARISWFSLPNSIWPGLQTVKLLIMQFPIALSYFVTWWSC